MPLPRTRVRRALATGLALLLVLGGCSGDDDDAAPSSSVAPTTKPDKPNKPKSTTTTAAEPTTTTIVPENQSLVAIAKRDSIDVYAKPKAKKPRGTITAAEAVTVPGVTPISFLGDKIDGGWLKAYLPIRPNGSMGWLRRSDVQESVHNYRVEVELRDHRMRVFRGDKVIVSVEVGVGRKDRPTPGGVYYIKELLQPPDSNSVYGSFAYGLSGFSTVLESFNGGSGVIGLHGTNDPSSIGKDVSSGCIRMRNNVIERLVNRIGLPLGTPVDIQK